MQRSGRVLLAIFVLALLPVSAQAIVVTTFADENGTGAECSLREAVRAINDAASFGGCTFVAGDTLVDLGTGTYTLSLEGAGRVEARVPMTIAGDGPTATTITQSGLDDDMLMVNLEDGPGTVSLTGFTITGQVPGTFGFGSAIIYIVNTDNTLLVTDVVVADNQGGQTPAFRVQGNDAGNLSLTRVVFENNVAAPEAGSATGAAFECDLQGGAEVTSVTATDVVFRDNQATSTSAAAGAAIFSDGCDLTLTNVTFVNNSAAAPESAGGALFARDYFGSTTTVSLTNVTFFGNSAGTGGAMFQGIRGEGGGPGVTLTNVTFAENTASVAGDHLYQDGTAASIRNVLFGPSPGADCAGNPAPALTLLGGNMDSDGTCGAEQTSATPGLAAALADNGGFTPTLALIAGGDAVDAGTNTGCPATDQRGVARPQDGDANAVAVCDVGAFELLRAQISMAEIPTLGGWMMGILGAMLAAAALLRLRS